MHVTIRGLSIIVDVVVGRPGSVDVEKDLSATIPYWTTTKSALSARFNFMVLPTPSAYHSEILNILICCALLTTSSMKTLQHLSPSLGAELTAEEDTEAELAYFRGIPYASVSKRWTQSVVQNSLPSIFDATTFGPKCPQPAHVSMITIGLEAPTVAVDEFACLNLNITVPKNVLPRLEEKNPASLLSVMVWIHGYVNLSSSPNHWLYCSCSILG